MKLFAVQSIRGRRPAGVDVSDLPWQDVPGHVDYSSFGEAHEAALEFDGAFVGDWSHRVRAYSAEQPALTKTAALVAAARRRQA